MQDSDMPQSYERVADLPVAIIGAGPIGLAAAAHLARREEPFVVLEAGPGPASSVQSWAHVILFTPWQYNVDQEAVALLEQTGWRHPESGAFPSGDDLVRHYLQPLSRHPSIHPHIRFNHRVCAIARDEIGKLDENRDAHPFVIDTIGPDGKHTRVLARAVIDASGSWRTPNPLGSNGLRVPGEDDLGDGIWYGIPDILRSQEDRYAGKRTLVVGSGHSAFHSLKQLAALAQRHPTTRVLWALRRSTGSDALIGCNDDRLTERTLLGRDIAQLLQDKDIDSFPGSRLTRLERTREGIVAYAGDRTLPPVDEIVVATGFRPDHGIARELRLDIHSVFESTYALAPLIDPDAHACGTAPPHGVSQLAHPEPDYYIVGMKSYGRAPTFLLLTGYEQVRSVVCALVGDEAALTVELELPEKGLCSACAAYLEAQDGRAGCACDPDDQHGDDCCAAPDARNTAESGAWAVA
jgi:thioredoxin reductase